jgi:hypothetical protein
MFPFGDVNLKDAKNCQGGARGEAGGAVFRTQGRPNA